MNHIFNNAIVISIGLLLLLLFGLQLFGQRLPGWGAVLVYLLIYAVVSSLLRAQKPALKQNAQEFKHWPTSGPIGRFGQAGLMLAFTLTGLLSLLNPFQLIQIVRQGLGNMQIRRRYRAQEIQHYKNKVRYTLPFSGEWFVYNGGVTEADSHSRNVLTQRYAYDFVMVDQHLKRHNGKGTRPDEYYCYGQDILAAAAGVVKQVEQHVRTAPFLGYGVVDFMARSFLGNYVIIEHAPGEFGLYAHLIPNSVPVSEGDPVKQGEVIGLCGHTGHSSEPHLHFHLQDREGFFTAAGLPIEFHDVHVDGQDQSQCHVRVGNRVAPAKAKSAAAQQADA